MKILIVDDDIDYCEMLKEILLKEKHETENVNSAEKALELLETQHFDLILTDLKMQELSGLDLIKQAQKNEINSIFIVINGHGSIKTAVEAMRAGAYDYIIKPIDYVELRHKLQEVSEEILFRKEVLQLYKVGELNSVLFFDEIFKNELYMAPYLIIIDEASKSLIDNLKLSNVEQIILSYDNTIENSIFPTKLHLLLTKVDEFVKNNQSGTIIFKGIENLITIHKWDHFKYFLTHLQTKISLNSTFNLVLLIDQKNKDDPMASLLRDALSVLVNSEFSKMVEVLGHPIRKNIIKLLNSNTKLTFSEITKGIEEVKSQNLAFHLNKLYAQTLIKKIDNYYYLTTSGEFLASIIYDLETKGLLNPLSHVKAIMINQRKT